jgi:hypothetical protein
MKTKFSFSLLFFACPFHHFPVSLKFATHCPVNRIGGVMVSVLASTAVDLVFETRSGQTKDCKIGVCCFSAKQATLRRKRAKTGRLESRIMCPSGAICLSVDSCFNELALLKPNSACWSRTKRTSSSSH